VSEVF